MDKDTEEFITDIQNISSKKVLIFINDEPSFVLYKNEPDKLGFKKGLPFLSSRKKELFEGLLYERALNRALGLIRTKDHTESEINTKLIKDFYPDTVISKVIYHLKEQDFINDRRYASSYIFSNSDTKSALVIRLNLMKKGIEKNIIEEEMDKYSTDNPDHEYELIYKLLSSKFDKDIKFSNEKESYKFRSKVYSFLMRKGFSFEKAETAVKNFFDI